jgi:cytochrome c5
VGQQARRSFLPTLQVVSVSTHDSVFLKRFSMIIAFLVVVTILLVAAAKYLYTFHPTEPNAVNAQRTAERLQPVGAVHSGETGAAAIAAAAQAATAAAATQAAFDGSLDGSVIFNGACNACHGTGAAGAPMLTKDAWAARQAQGIETLVTHAKNGFQGAVGIMPPRGGNPAISDEQIDATVRWMLDNLK